jgi:hypothetical protein
MTTLQYDQHHVIRDTDTMIIYKDIKSTGTNEYGYEIIVDSNGIVISDSSAGNSPIQRADLYYPVTASSEGAPSIYKRGAKVVY